MRRILETARRSLRDRRGAVALIFGLVAPVLIGVIALGVEVGMWYTSQARMQEVADAAAIAADRELAAGSGKLAAAATLAAQLNNCSGGSCTLGTPTTFRSSSATSSGDNGIQVTAQTTFTPLLAKLFLPTNSQGQIVITATGRAAYVTQTTGGIVGCVLGLDSNAAYTVALNNNAAISCNTMSNSKCQGKGSTTCTFDATVYSSYSCSSSIDPQCNASINTKSLASMYLANNAAISANGVAAGNIYLDNNATVTTKTPNSTQASDPYGSVTLSVPSSTAAHTVAGGNGSSSGAAIDISIASGKCSTAAVSYTNNVYVKIHPGCYNGWDLENNATVTLDAGTYYIKSQFHLKNNAILTATSGTTLVFVGSGSNSYAIDVGNNANLSIVAPSSGTFSGIAIMSDPAAKEPIVQTFSNNAVLNVKGAIYFPKQILDMENNASGSGSNGCLQLIARRVLLSNNANFGQNCSGVGTTDISVGQQVTRIVDLVQ